MPGALQKLLPKSDGFVQSVVSQRLPSLRLEGHAWQSKGDELGE